jgi:type I restriction enzyme S subunit
MTGKLPHRVAPRLRFPEFAGEPAWECIPLNKLAKRITRRNTQGVDLRPLTNSAEHGVVDQREYFDRDIATNTENYFVVEPGDYVYNPRVSSAAPVGPISKNTVGIGVMSPLYTIFQFRSDANDFFEHYFQSSHWHEYLRHASNSGARHDRMAITNVDFMGMPIPTPSPAERQKIADCLGSLDDLIAAEGRKLEALRRHKQGLMQQLFPQPGETVPRLRFPEFEGGPEWRRQTLGEAATFLNGRAYSKDELLDSGKYRVLRVGNFFTSDHWYYSDLELDDGKYCDNGDLLYAWSASFGPRIWRGERVIYHYHIWKVVERKRIDRGFLYACLECETQRMRDASARGLGMQHLTKKGIESWECAIPTDPDEQRRISECLNAAEAGVDAQGRLLDALQRHKRGLLQQIFPTAEASTP